MGVIVQVKIAFLTDIDINTVNDIEEFTETQILDNIGEQFKDEKFEVNEYASIADLKFKTDERYRKSEYQFLLEDIQRKYPNISNNKVVFIADAEIKFTYCVYPATYWEPEDDNYSENFEHAYDSLYNRIESELKSLVKDSKIEMFDVDYDEIIGDYDDRDYDSDDF